MKRIFIAVLSLLVATISNAQTGFPLWGSFETSGFDAVNRQNMNVHITIPLVSTPSRAGSFGYTLVYDSLIWTKTGTAWTPVADASGNPTWGWKNNQPLGSTKYFKATAVCDTVPRTTTPEYNGYTYTDGSGTVHRFNIDFYQIPTACNFNTGPRTGFATDRERIQD